MNYPVRFGLILLSVLVCAYLLVPTAVQPLPDWWQRKFYKDRVKLGLDLQGGTYLLLEVQLEEALTSSVDRNLQILGNAAQEKSYEFKIKERPTSTRAVIVTNDASEKMLGTLIENEYPIFKRNPLTASEGKVEFELELTGAEALRIRQSSMDQSLEMMRNRIDAFGVSEPTIQRQGDDKVAIQLPGLKDPRRAEDIIGRTAKLDFKLLDQEAMGKVDLQSEIAKTSQADPKVTDDIHLLNEALKGIIPDDAQVLYQRDEDQSTGRVTRFPVLVRKVAALTGEDLDDARVNFDQFSVPYVSLTFNKKGGKLFADFTGEHVGDQLAIVLDETVYSAPRINEKIEGGHAQITGSFSTDEAHDLAIVLRSGALPAPVKIAERRIVGPSLGQDSIRNGLYAMAVGAALVAVFMLFYYRLSGIIAVVAVGFSLALIAACLTLFKATLTLPGLAGIALTIGMSVDANILIFERIKEELGLGKGGRAATDAGYKRAFLTILDANITTLITSVILFQFGTGPIRGFAVTLSVGLLANMFTAVFVCRTLQNFIMDKFGIRKVSV
ncbi:MAG: protein translocase subunit SecD [Nitrospirae bacterium]|nr:protein translocase subunit SecD [Nitrospirota bacterium]